MSDVQPSNTEFRRLLDVVGDLAAEVRSLKERQGPGHDVRLYTVPTSPPAAGPPVSPAPGPAPEAEVLPEAARLHRAIAYDKMERILAKDAAVYKRSIDGSLPCYNRDHPLPRGTNLFSMRAHC